MDLRLGIAVSVLLVGAAACGSRVAVLPAPSAPHFPEFVEPVVPADLAKLLKNL